MRFGGRASIIYVLAASLLAVAPVPVHAAQGSTITTVAGGAGQGPATQVAQRPEGLAIRGGALLVSDTQYGVVRSIDLSTRNETLFAGTCPGYAGDGGPALAAGLSANRVAAASDGTVYIVDAVNMVVRKVDSNGTITTFAGRAGTTGGFSGDGGPATMAMLNVPTGVAVDGAGNVYIADRANWRVRMVNTARIITTVAGNGNYSGAEQDGIPATQASLSWPQTVTIDNNGDLLISDQNRIRRVSGGIITTVSGSGALRVAGMTVDRAGNIYYADEYGSQVKMAGSGTVIAGTGEVGYSGDGGPAVAAKLTSPEDVAVDANGNLFIADEGNYRVRVVSGGIITTYAGTGSASTGDGGPASQATISFPSKVAFDSKGNYYFAELSRNVVRKVDTNGTISIFAGNGNGGFSGDGGPATSASLWEPRSVAVDPSDNLLIADARNGRIRRVDHVTGVITTIAGGGSTWVDNVAATATTLAYPWGIALDHLGQLYIAEPYNAAVVRRVDLQGIIHVVAGGNTGNDPGDGSLATNAFISRIEGIALDASDNLYIADTATHHTIRRVDHGTGIITTVAGQTFKPGYGGDGGPATQAFLQDPGDVAVAANGDLYIADQNNHRIRRVSGGTITTAVGTGDAGCAGDGGPPEAAQLSWPIGVTFDAHGNLYISHDTRIRKVSGPDYARALTYYFAEGYTGPGFTETLALFMPGRSGTAMLDYVTAAGTHVSHSQPLTQGKVTLVDVNQQVGPNQEVSVKVSLPGPGVVERLLHFDTGTWHGSTDVVGATAPASEWDFAEGSTLDAFSEFLTLQNANGGAVPVTLNYFDEGGALIVKTLTLPASSRTTVEVFNGTKANVSDCVPNGPGANCGVGRQMQGVSVQVKAGAPIVAERPFYVNGYDFGDGVIRDGHDAFGATSPDQGWYFAEGTTLPGFKEYLTLQNPGAPDATATLTYFTNNGQTPTKTVLLKANSRTTVEVFKGDLGNVTNCVANGSGANCGVGPNVQGVSLQVRADKPIIAERPMYMVHDFGSGLVAGAHVVVGATVPGRLLGFAAASTTAGENDYLTIQNPGTSAANIAATYFSSSGQIVRDLQVPPGTRTTVEVFNSTEGAGSGFDQLGIVIASDQPVLVEKPTYSSNPPSYGATDAIGPATVGF